MPNVVKDLVLCRAQNHGFISLWDETKNEVIGIRRRDGSYQYVPWLGLISKAEAKNIGMPVKLEILRIGRGDSWNVDWKLLGEGQHVQGCYTKEGAYALVDVDVVLV